MIVHSVYRHVYNDLRDIWLEQDGATYHAAVQHIITILTFLLWGDVEASAYSSKPRILNDFIQ